MTDKTHPTVADWGEIWENLTQCADEIAAQRRDITALREEVADLRRELTAGPLAAVAREETMRQIASAYWQKRYAGDPEPA